jgi:hypothetical protein
MDMQGKMVLTFLPAQPQELGQMVKAQEMQDRQNQGRTPEILKFRSGQIQVLER